MQLNLFLGGAVRGVLKIYYLSNLFSRICHWPRATALLIKTANPPVCILCGALYGSSNLTTLLSPFIPRISQVRLSFSLVHYPFPFRVPWVTHWDTAHLGYENLTLGGLSFNVSATRHFSHSQGSFWTFPISWAAWAWWKGSHRVVIVTMWSCGCLGFGGNNLCILCFLLSLPFSLGLGF